jgi:hypothetical protein
VRAAASRTVPAWQAPRETNGLRITGGYDGSMYPMSHAHNALLTIAAIYAANSSDALRGVLTIGRGTATGEP